MSWRGLAALAALLGVVWVTASSALAQPEVQLVVAADGSLMLVGDGWRPGEKLEVAVGRAVFPAFADSTGEFEVRTGLSGAVTLPVTVRRLETPTPPVSRVDFDVPLPEAAPNPLAVALAQGMLAAGAGVTLLLTALGAVAFVRRAR